MTGAVGAARKVLAALLRVSSDEQMEKGTIATQRREIAAWAERNGYEVVFFEDAGVSGTIPLAARPAAGMMLQRLHSGEFAGVVVWRTDRIARDAVLLLNFTQDLTRRGLELHSVTEHLETATAAGELGVTVLAGVAQYQRRTIIENSIGGQRRVAAEGRWLGGIVPYGYTLDARRYPTPSKAAIPGRSFSEAKVVQCVFRWYAKRGLSADAIARTLNRLGVPTAYAIREQETLMGEVLGTRAHSGKRLRRTAEQWTDGAIRRLLRSETYKGVHRFGRRGTGKVGVIERAVLPLVESSLWEAAQTRLRDNLRWSGRNSQRPYLLRGLMTCECGHILTGCHYKTVNGDDVLQYACSSHPKGEKPPRIWAAELEAKIWADVLGFVDSPDAMLTRVAADSTSSLTRSEDLFARQLLEVGRELKSLDAQEERLIELATQVPIAPDKVAKRLRIIAERRRELQESQAQLRDAHAEAARADARLRDVRSILERLASQVRGAQPKQRAAICRLLVKNATLARETDGYRLIVTYAFGPSRLPSSRSGVHRLQHVEGFPAPDLPHDDPVRPHP